MAYDSLNAASSFQANRRQFFIGSARSSAAMTALTLGAGSLTSIGLTGIAEAAVSAPAEDLLASLGTRLAIEVQSQIGTAEAGYSVHFVNCAGPSCDAVRSGFQKGLQESLHEAISGHGLKFEEVQGNAMGSLARVTVQNLDTGRRVSIDLLPESLSQISLIEERTQDPVARRHLLSQAASGTLFQRLSA